jgi:hypothetical protein
MYEARGRFPVRKHRASITGGHVWRNNRKKS